MEEKHAIEVKDLVISYQNLKKTSIKKTLLHLKRQKPDRFVAVKGISFYVREGEILGIIGKNGSGKSTTLNALAGIFSPDSGSIDLNGHSISRKARRVLILCARLWKITLRKGLR